MNLQRQTGQRQTGQRQRGAAALPLAALAVLALPASMVFAQNETPSSTLGQFRTDPNFLSKNPSGVTRDVVFKTLGALVMVVALGVGGLMLFKRVFPQISGAGSRSIKIQETALLGPRKYLHVVEVSNQRLLLGSTNDRITMLAHLVDELSRLDMEPDQERESG